MNAAVVAAIAVGVGTAVGSGRAGVAVPLAVCASVVAIASVVVRRLTIVLALMALGFATGASAAFRTGAMQHAVAPTVAGEGVVDVCGDVRAQRARSFEMRADRIERREIAWRTSETVVVIGRDALTLSAGDRVCLRGEIARPRPGRERDPPLLVADRVISREPGSRVRAAAAAVRARFSQAAQRVMPDTQAGLLLGMTDGDTALLDDATIEAFRTTGLAHLVAVSGSNVAVLLVVVMLIARRAVPRRRWPRVMAALPVLVFFAFLTGMEASVLRAVVTASIALVVAAQGRTTDGLRLASFAFVVLVGASPELLFHPGFQLSFAATMGLILWAAPVSEAIARRLPDGRAGRAVALCVGTTFAAQAAAAPFLAWHFGRIPAIGALANLVVAPLAPVVMVGGVATLGAASLVDALAFAPELMRLPIDLILWCGRTFATLPAASVRAGVLVASVLTAAFAAMFTTTRRGRLVALTLAVATGSTAIGGAAATSLCPGASVVALDVGQGTAVLLRDADHAVLVDGGPEQGDVVADLAEQHVSALDAIFVSHPHADHTQGLVEVLGSLDVGAVFAPATIGWGQGAPVVRAAREESVPLTIVAAGDAYAFGDLAVEVLFPDSDEEPPRDEEAVHGYSLVLRARVGGASVLLPGDVGAQEEDDLLAEPVASDVLVAPHHGSKDLDPAFVDAVDPRVVLVTVGEDNRYGHPAPEAMRTYAATARTYRTDRDGVVSVCVHDGTLEVRTRR